MKVSKKSVGAGGRFAHMDIKVRGRKRNERKKYERKKKKYERKRTEEGKKIENSTQKNF